MRAVVLALALILPTLAVFAPDAEAATVNVTVSNFSFTPPNVAIAPGDTVQWNWASGTHNVRSLDDFTYWCGTRSSGSCSKTFETPGTYDYYCAIHGTGMSGRVSVQGPPPTISIDSPADGSSVSGTFTVAGTATSDSGVTKVEVRINNGAWLLASGTTSWSRSIDTTAFSNGAKTIEARVTAADSQTVAASIGVTVANPEVFELWMRSLQGETAVTGSPTITTSVQNLGNVNLVTSVLFEYKHKGDWKTIRTDTVTVPAKTVRSLSFAWDDIWLYGRFDIRAIVDPTDAIAESDESNNLKQHSAAFYTASVNGIDLRDP